MSRTFEMDDADILKEYREAKFPREQIKILAEQNLVAPKVMREFIMEKLGSAPELRSSPKRPGCFRWTDDNIEKVRELAGKRMSDSEIAEQMGVSVSSVRQLRYAQGIPIGKHIKRKRA